MPFRRNGGIACSHGAAAADSNDNDDGARFASARSNNGNSNSDRDSYGCKSVFNRGASQIPLQRWHRRVG